MTHFKCSTYQEGLASIGARQRNRKTLSRKCCLLVWPVLVLMSGGCDCRSSREVAESVFENIETTAREPRSGGSGEPRTASGTAAATASHRAEVLLREAAYSLRGTSEVLYMMRSNSNSTTLHQLTTGGDPEGLGEWGLDETPHILGAVEGTAYLKSRTSLTSVSGTERSVLFAGDEPLRLFHRGDTHIYLAVGGGRTVSAAPSRIVRLLGDTTEEFRGEHDDTVTGIAEHGGHIYFSTAPRPQRALDHLPGRLSRIALEEGRREPGAEEVLLLAESRPTELQVFSGGLYLLTTGTPGAGFGDGELCRYERGGCVSLVNGLELPNNLVVLGEHLCFRHNAAAHVELLCYEPEADLLTRVATTSDESNTTQLYGPTAFAGALVWSTEDLLTHEQATWQWRPRD